MQDPFKGLTFAPDKMPEPEDGPEKLRELEVDCCTDPECVQRDWQRAVALLLERLTQAYCAMQLVRWHTGEVWPCDGSACTDDRCRFGLVVQNTTDLAEKALVQGIVSTFAGLSVTAADLRGEWHGLTEADLARMALEDLLKRFHRGDLDEVGLSSESIMFLEHFREEVAGDDRDAYKRWFEPPTHARRPG